MISFDELEAAAIAKLGLSCELKASKCLRDVESLWYKSLVMVPS